jgi:DNA-directed RNA polymerase specialized sigma24 family protein
MSITLTRSGTVTGTVLARAPASDSSDEMLVERIAAGNKLAQVLFARHRTPIYRWLYRVFSNETVAEHLLREVFLRRVAAGRTL